MRMKYQSFEEFSLIAVRNPGQPEYMQAVAEVMESLWPFIAQASGDLPSMVFWIAWRSRSG